MSVSKRRKNRNGQNEPPKEKLPSQGDVSGAAGEAFAHATAPLAVRPSLTGAPVRGSGEVAAFAAKHRPRPAWMFLTLAVLSLFVLGFYVRAYNPHRGGWTRLVDFGAYFDPNALPRLKKTRHHLVEGYGNDGQFYAQLSIDPTVRDLGFNQALDNPAYRSRRILTSALSFCLGWAKPKRVIQAYALSNLLFWFVLAGAMTALARPWTARQAFGVAATLLSFGAITSMEHAMVDLPAAALIFVGLALSSWSRYAALAAAALTRETSVLAALAGLDFRRPFAETWRRNLGYLLLAGVPITLWVAYISHRFDGLQSAAGIGNFGFPLVAMADRLRSGVADWIVLGPTGEVKAAGPFGWLYLDERLHEVLSVLALFFQGLYLVLRRDGSSAVWRTGLMFTILCAVFGPAVWGWTGAAARVLLPMTAAFYLCLAREEDDRWFWPFAILGSVALPFGVYEFWNYQ